MRCVSVRAWSLAALLAVHALGAAQEQGDLYQGRAAVTEESDGERDRAARQALVEALIKLTGRADVAALPALAGMLERAPRLLSGHRYARQLEGDEDGRVYRSYLIADFDPTAVDAALAEAGLVAWPRPRPMPILWLAIDDGRGPRLLTAAQGATVDALRAAANRRGIAVVLPEGTPEESNFGIQAAWREDEEAAQALLSRHASPVQLIGRLYRAGSGWRGDWRMLEHGRELERWSRSGADARALLASAGDAAADLLARRFLRLLEAGPPGLFTVRVEGLAGADDYPRLMGYLGALGAVRRARPLAADPGGLWLELDLVVGLDGFSGLVASGPLLRRRESAGDPVVFDLLP